MWHVAWQLIVIIIIINIIMIIINVNVIMFWRLLGGVVFVHCMTELIN